jgi:hypothetical protein
MRARGGLIGALLVKKCGDATMTPVSLGQGAEQIRAVPKGWALEVAKGAHGGVRKSSLLGRHDKNKEQSLEI